MKRGIKLNWMFYLGLATGLFFLISYFIPINLDSGANFVTTTPLLGILIFYNPFILALYILIVAVLFFKGMSKN